jgi:protein gp37
VPEKAIRQIFGIMAKGLGKHTFQILTKNEQSASMSLHRGFMAKNIWMGVTVDSEAYAYRYGSSEEKSGSSEIHSLNLFYRD